MKVTRAQVYSALDSEIEYARTLWGDTYSSGTAGDGSRSIDEFALYIEEYSAQLRHLAGTTSFSGDKLDAIRKVGALCVTALEQHGAPHRVADPIL